MTKTIRAVASTALVAGVFSAALLHGGSGFNGRTIADTTISVATNTASFSGHVDANQTKWVAFPFDVEVTGPIKVVLWAASSAPDTDFTAKLVDVHPSGFAVNVAQGIIRARYRDSFAQPTLLEPGRVYRYEIDCWSSSNCFGVGHRIRVEISSSNFPQFDRNPNTGHAFGMDADLQPATQTIYHDARHPSHILLPVVA